MHGGGQSHDAAGNGCHVREFGQGKAFILAIANDAFSEKAGNEGVFVRYLSRAPPRCVAQIAQG
jgi:hypothetical protein